MAGKRSRYSRAMAEKICGHIIEGKSVNQIAELKGMPSVRTIWEWLAIHSEFRQMYESAKELSADYLFSESIQIADDCEKETAAIQKAGLRVKARIAAAGRNAPRKGANVTINNSNSNTAAAQATSEATAMNIELNWTQKPYSQWTPEDIKQYEFNRLAALYEDDLLSPEELAEELTYTFRIENGELKKVKKQC